VKHKDFTWFNHSVSISQEIISPFFRTTDNRFGFRAGHAADQCSFLLKQTASYFVTHGSSGHAVFYMPQKHSIEHYT